VSVYFITAREVGRVKIGYSNKPRSRVLWLSANSPVEVALEAVIDGGIMEEGDLHQRFAEHRVKGEWFTLCPAIEEMIAANPIETPTATPRDDSAVEQVISFFGSATELARRLDVPMTTVASWRQRGCIPAWRLGAIHRLVTEAA
jgi:hypothetical protein